MKYKVVVSKEIVWCEYDDRYVLIVKDEEKIIGLNFMQGDELEKFKEDFTYVDEELTDFYNAVSSYLVGESELDRINQAIWAFHSYTVSRDDREFNK